MASNQYANSAPNQTAHSVLPSETRLLRPPVTDADFDQYLVAARDTIDTLRNFTWSKIIALDQAKKHRLECTDAYKRLYFQHGETVAELNGMVSKNESMDLQLDEANKALSFYKSMISEYEQRQLVGQEPGRAGLLETRIKDLEGEMAAMIEKQGSALSNAADRIKLTERRIDELNNEKEQMAQAYEISLNNADNCTATALQNIAELEKENQDLALALAISAELVNGADEGANELEQGCLQTDVSSDSTETMLSSTSEKRARPKDEIQTSSGEQDPPKRGRRRSGLGFISTLDRLAPHVGEQVKLCSPEPEPEFAYQNTHSDVDSDDMTIYEDAYDVIDDDSDDEIEDEDIYNSLDLDEEILSFVSNNPQSTDYLKYKGLATVLQLPVIRKPLPKVRNGAFKPRTEL
ncbi:hypothetical protein V492_00390 [Pseudogymnoascus sp. VKM F-4246]|nr:hypothetical protein V492_00390 [Pseudogymnoascus sp. VKM F-4246]